MAWPPGSFLRPMPLPRTCRSQPTLAARVGYETTALTLPIALRANEVPAPASIALPIVVGRTNPFVKALVEKGAIAIKDLAPGQGLVAFVSSPLGGPDGIVVVGGDDAGTLAAGTALAAYLKARGVPASQASVTALVIDSDRRGLKSLVVRTSVGAAYVPAAMRALGDLDLAHRRGAEAGPSDSPRSTSVGFASEARTAGNTVASTAAQSPVPSARCSPHSVPRARGAHQGMVSRLTPRARPCRQTAHDVWRAAARTARRGSRHR